MYSTAPGSGIAGIVQGADATYVKLFYDPALRLQREEYYNAANLPQSTISYTYDDQGNRTSRTTKIGNATAETQAYAIDPVSGFRLTGVSGGSTATFGYDAGGRMNSLVRGTTNAALAYNAAGQLKTVNNNSGSDYGYQYDAHGNLMAATTTTGSTTTTRTFLVAPAAQRLGAGALDVTVQHMVTNAANGQLLAGWVYAGENPLLRFDASNNRTYYLEDASDSIAALVSHNRTSGQLTTTHHKYDGFGVPLAGSAAPNNAATGGDFGFHGAWRENGTNLYHMRARVYDAATGRFTTPDPIDPTPQQPETYEPYSFANNNPHLFSDPTGLFSLVEINISGNIQAELNNLKAVAVQQAKAYIQDKVVEAATSALFNGLVGLLPGGLLVDATIIAKNAQSAGNLFGLGVRKVICHERLESVAQYVRFEVPVNPNTGHVTGNGLGCSDEGVTSDPYVGQKGVSNLPGSRRKPVRPDAIIGPPGVVSNLFASQGPQGNESKTYVATEFKLSATSLADEVKPSSRQITGIANYTKQHTTTGRVAVFVTLFNRNKAHQVGELEIARAVKKLNAHFGILGVVYSLSNAQNPFDGK